jgi:hypothetical protein
MLKTVSSIINAIGALNYKGTWDANANSPALTSSVGTKGDYYVVGTAGSTNLNGISNWGVGDWAAFNGSVWQRVEGGANLNGVDLSVSGTTTLSGLIASTALALDASKNVVSVTNTGSGNNVLATAPTLVDDVSLSTGNLVISTSGKGIDFSATPGTGTSELLADYEEGTWTPTDNSGAGLTFDIRYAKYTRVGRAIHIVVYMVWPVTASAANAALAGLPFTNATNGFASLSLSSGSGTALGGQVNSAATTINIFPASNYNLGITNASLSAGGVQIAGTYFVS